MATGWNPSPFEVASSLGAKVGNSSDITMDLSGELDIFNIKERG